MSQEDLVLGPSRWDELRVEAVLRGKDWREFCQALLKAINEERSLLHFFEDQKLSDWFRDALKLFPVDSERNDAIGASNPVMTAEKLLGNAIKAPVERELLSQTAAPVAKGEPKGDADGPTNP